MESSRQNRRDDPQPLGDVISHLFALRGYGRTQTGRQLVDIWRMVAGETIAGCTRVQGVKAGVLQVGVQSSAMLQELQGFHKGSLLEALQRNHADLGLRDIKFRLNQSAGHRHTH